MPTPGLKTIIALSFVRRPLRTHSTRAARALLKPREATSTNPLSAITGPRNRLPPRHPLLGAMEELPTLTRRRDLRPGARAQLAMRSRLERGRLYGQWQ